MDRGQSCRGCVWPPPLLLGVEDPKSAFTPRICWGKALGGRGLAGKAVASFQLMLATERVAKEMGSPPWINADLITVLLSFSKTSGVFKTRILECFRSKRVWLTPFYVLLYLVSAMLQRHRRKEVSPPRSGGKALSESVSPSGAAQSAGYSSPQNGLTSLFVIRRSQSNLRENSYTKPYTYF